jgi:hypothetical protein
MTMGDSAAAPLLDPAEGGDDEPFLGLAWAEAIEATELLRSALAALGLVEEIPRLRGDVNVYGRPMVTLGRICPTAARRLAAALSRAAQNQARIYGQAPPDGESGSCGSPVPGGGTGAGAGDRDRPGLRPPRTATPLNIPVAIPMATVLPATVPAPMPAPLSAPTPAPIPAPAAAAQSVSPADSIRLPA